MAAAGVRPHWRLPLRSDLGGRHQPAAKVVMTPMMWELEPALCQRHSCARAAGRGAPPRQAERDPEPGPAPCCCRSWGSGVWSQYQRALTFAVAPEPRSVSVSVCLSTPVLCASPRSLSSLEVESAHGSGQHPSRPWPRTSARLRADRLFPQSAASVPSLKPPLLLGVLSGGKDDACLG
ncbi:hypothetical protein NDU88_004627 [Pleurodeles waltl]|uniref:Uncharacterized protein n=1 Tax=Pleurodeles waltl TaxID=8319 RepID=A0AAV7LIN3_PLEWA|nr:hypothetical protein NDU88_004627 [Pleurodeles waltl]